MFWNQQLQKAKPCATAKNGCAGQNSCKGKSWLKVSHEGCSSRGGQIFPEEEKK